MLREKRDEALLAKKDELLRLQRAHARLEQQVRTLTQRRLHVRPRDIKTLERAKSLLDGPAAEAHRARAAAEGEVSEASARVKQLRQRQRTLQLAAHAHVAELTRDQLEERILDEELAEASPAER